MEEPKKIAEIDQRPFPFRRQRLTLWEDRIELRVDGLLERFRFPYYLHVIKEEPDRVRVVPWLKLLFAAACLGGASALAPFRGIAEPILALGLGLSGTIVLALALPLMRARLVYAYRPIGPDGPRTRYEPHLYLSDPSAPEVVEFVGKIAAVQKRHIEKLKSEHEGDAGIAYARELERFATLREKNVLTEHEFVQVKAKLLNLKPRRIGF